MTPRIGKWNEGNRLHAWSAKGTINLCSIRGVQDVPAFGTTCGGPLVEVHLWGSVCGGPFVEVHFFVYPFTQPKCTPSPSPSVPPHPAKVYPSTQPKCTPPPSQSAIPSLVITNWYWVLRIMLLCWTSVSLYTQSMGFSQKVGIYFWPETNLFLLHHC